MPVTPLPPPARRLSGLQGTLLGGGHADDGWAWAALPSLRSLSLRSNAISGTCVSASPPPSRGAGYQRHCHWQPKDTWRMNDVFRIKSLACETTKTKVTTQQETRGQLKFTEVLKISIFQTRSGVLRLGRSRGILVPITQVC